MTKTSNFPIIWTFELERNKQVNKDVAKFLSADPITWLCMRLWLCFPPSISLGMDKFVWALMSDGTFSTMSTYDHMDLATWVELNITLKGVMGVLWIGIFALLKLLTKYGDFIFWVIQVRKLVLYRFFGIFFGINS